MLKKNPAQFFTLALLLSLLTLVAGCFDYQVDFTLNPTGQGRIITSLDMPKNLAGKTPPNNLDSLLYPLPRKTTELSETRVIIKERSDFSWLDVVVANRVWFKVERTRIGVLGVTDYTYRVYGKLQSMEGENPDRDILPGLELLNKKQDQAPTYQPETKARSLMARGLVGHYVTMRFNVPGKVVKAWPVILGSETVTPLISKDKSSVFWKIPLSVLINEKVRANLNFKADFKGQLEFKGKGQIEANSRYPSGSDMKWIEKERNESSKRNKGLTK